MTPFHLGLVVDHQRTAAHDIAAVPHLALTGTDLLRVLRLITSVQNAVLN